MNPKVNYEFWMIIMYQCRYSNYNNVAALVGMLMMGEAVPVWGQETRQKSLYLLFKVDMNLKLL